MISTVQKARIIDRILKELFLKGKTPRIGEIREKLAKLLVNKQVGMPIFTPRAVAGKNIVDPNVLRANATEIKEDIDTLADAIVEILEEEAVVFGASVGEIQELKNRLTKIKEDLEAHLNQEHNQGREVLFDNFRDSSKIDLENTTAFISTAGGYVTLPTSEKETVVFPARDISLVKEQVGENVKVLGSNFVGVFSDYADKVWQAEFTNQDTYIADVNLTGKSVIAGHENEVYINRIFVDPLTPVNIEISVSTDGLNWEIVANSSITNQTYFSFGPVWALFIRFKISGIGHLGIRQISIGKVATVESATLRSKALKASKGLYSLLFNVKEEVPPGTSISHYFSTKQGGPWSPIYPGKVSVLEETRTNETFSTEATLDTTSSLYKYQIHSSNAIIESGELKRGVSQFKVSAFSFDWEMRGDTYHIPQVTDYEENLGHILTCYMSPATGVTGLNIAPQEIINNKSSFIINYTSGDQRWWGVPLVSSGKLVLRPNYNYKITTYLYSDRELLLSNAGGGIYALGGSFTGVKGIGWALVINDLRVVYDNSIFVVASIPGTGAFTTETGRAFPLSLQNGWNKIELFIYVPGENDLTSILTQNMVLLLRPDIIDFRLPDSDNWNYTPKQTEYPIWADGTTMKRVSEFYLKWNVPILNNDYWAWGISAASGTPSHVVINYNPTISSNTIDGRYRGSNEIFQISYLTDYSQTTDLYYRCDLARSPGTARAPSLYSYEFISLI